MFSLMKALVAVLGICYALAEDNDHWPRRRDRKIHPQTRGFADADLEGDASMRFMKNEVREEEEKEAHVEKEGGVSENLQGAQPHVEAKDPVVLQHEIERMAERMKRVGIEDGTIEMADQLDDIEVSLENSDPALQSEIVSTREELCAERGFQGHELEECDHFMHQACGPRANSPTRGKAARVPKLKCQHFFIASRRVGTAKAKAAVVAHFDAARDVAIAPAPAASSPNSAPGPATRLFGGKFYRELPDQGFMGELVKHDDKQSLVKDWGKEFGPSSGQREFEAICAEHPHNEWCRIHGYYRVEPKRSGAVPARATLAVAVIFFALHAAVLQEA